MWVDGGGVPTDYIMVNRPDMISRTDFCLEFCTGVKSNAKPPPVRAEKTTSNAQNFKTPNPIARNLRLIKQRLKCRPLRFSQTVPNFAP